MILLADIGGTNMRFALWEKGAKSRITLYKCADFSSIYQAIDTYINEKSCSISGMIIGVAGIVENNQAQLTNAKLSIETDSLKEKYTLDFVYLVNDFILQGYGVLDLYQQALLPLKPDKNTTSLIKTVIGVGTGLGVSYIVFDDKENPIICSSEAGHSNIACSTLNQFKIIHHLILKQSYIAFEDILSGPGLVRFYEVIATLNANLKNDTQWQEEKNKMGAAFNINTLLYHAFSNAKKTKRTIRKAEDVALLAKNGNETALLAFWYFFQFLGIFASSIVLSLKSTGGVFFVGDFLKDDLIKSLFEKSLFRQSFENNDKFFDYLKKIPTHIVLQKDTPFIGLSYLAHKQK